MSAAFKGVPSDPSRIGLPVRLFRLRQQARFLERTGCPLEALTSQLDTAAVLIGEGERREAADILDEARGVAEALDERITEDVITVAYPGESIALTAPAAELNGALDLAKPLGLRFDDDLARRLRDHNFEGHLEFEYLDDGDKQFWVLTDPARPDVRTKRNVARLYSEVCRIKKDDTGQWVSAKVEVYKVNSAFTHKLPTGADFIFGGEGAIRNIRFIFRIFEPGGA